MTSKVFFSGSLKSKPRGNDVVWQMYVLVETEKKEKVARNNIASIKKTKGLFALLPYYCSSFISYVYHLLYSKINEQRIEKILMLSF